MNVFDRRRATVSAVVALLAMLAGCRSDVPAVDLPQSTERLEIAREAGLQEQVAAVQRGESTRVEIAQGAITNNQLIAVGNLTELRELLLDHADSQFAPDAVACLAALPHLEHLRIRGSGIDNECLSEVAKCKSLRIVNLPHGVFDDDGLAQLAELPELESLRFGSPSVSDKGMQTLASFPSLKRLHLIEVPITDAGLAELAKIDRLESLYIDGGSISDAAWDDLFRQRPKLHVHVNQEHHDRDPHKHPH